MLAVCISIVPLLSGCILLPIAAVGYLGVKGVQAVSKSTYEVHLDTPTVEDTNALALVNSIALWPESKGRASSFGQGNALVADAPLADDLTKESKLDVISPTTVVQVLQTNGLPQSTDEMTLKEKLHAFRVVAEKTGADAVLATAPADMKDDSRFFSFKRASETFTAQVQIYSKAKDDFVWQDNVIVVWKKGSTLPSDAEIQKSVAEALAKRILEITGKVPVTTTNTNTPTPVKTP
jgi:hypothetical protein